MQYFFPLVTLHGIFFCSNATAAMPLGSCGVPGALGGALRSVSFVMDQDETGQKLTDTTITNTVIIVNSTAEKGINIVIYNVHKWHVST